jgi:YVTN family beta-propeller protein
LKRKRIAGLMLACLVALATVPAASAATPSNAWLAKVGSAGTNGTARILAYTSGTGSIAFKLAKLSRSRTLAVTLRSGSCAGSALLTLASIRTSSTGTVSKTVSLTASQVRNIKAAGSGTNKFAIRIGSGSSAKCGVFAVQSVPAYVAATIKVGPSPSGVVVDSSGVWVTNWWDNTLSRLHPTSNSVLAVFPIAMDSTQGPEAITAGAGSLWVTTYGEDESGAVLPGSVLRIEPASGATLATIPSGRGGLDIAFGAGAVWVANYDDGTVVRIDPATNQVAATIPIPKASGVAVDASGAWAVAIDGTVARIDPLTNQVVTTIPTQLNGGQITTAAGAVWVSHPGSGSADDGSVSRIDPATNQVVANVPAGREPWDLVVTGGSVWVASYDLPIVTRINATTNKVVASVAMPYRTYAMAAGTRSVWAVHNLPMSQGAGTMPAGSVSHVVF